MAAQLDNDSIPLLPTPAAADSHRGSDYARAGREQSGSDDLLTALLKLQQGQEQPIPRTRDVHCSVEAGRQNVAQDRGLAAGGENLDPIGTCVSRGTCQATSRSMLA